MGWEAIEKYLVEVEREIGDIFDQTVPQMLSDESDRLPMDLTPMTQTHVFYPDHMAAFPATISVVMANPSEATPDIDESTEYLNLDQDSIGTSSTSSSQDLSIYDKDFYGCSPLTENDGHFEYTELHKHVKRENINDGFNSTHGNDNHVHQSRDSIDGHVLCPGNQLYGYEEQEQMYQTMTSKIFSECIQDVEYTCNILRISPDPLVWASEHVQQWIAWQCRQFNVALPNMDYFQMTGEELCCLTEEQFKMYASEAGSILSSRLDIWRSDYISRPQISQIPVPTSPSLPSSPDISSPSPSDDGLPDQKSQTFIIAKNKRKPVTICAYPMNLSTAIVKPFNYGSF